MGQRAPGAVERFWLIVLTAVRWLRLPHPVWRVVFSFWDDAAGCGCWRKGTVVPHRRWSESVRR